jgi:hypothetical protein
VSTTGTGPEWLSASRNADSSSGRTHRLGEGQDVTHLRREARPAGEVPDLDLDVAEVPDGLGGFQQFTCSDLDSPAADGVASGDRASGGKQN